MNIMLNKKINKKMIEKFKQIEKIINDCDLFEFYTFDDFIECFVDETKIDSIYYEYQIETLKTKYHCNNDNTIILLCRDCYLLLNFETNDKIIMHNFDILYVNDKRTINALYRILFDLFVDDLY